MSDDATGRRVPAWRVGDHAIINQANGKPASIEVLVTATFPISASDADKLRIKYPAIKAGELVLVLADRQGRTYHRIASDPDLVCIITHATKPTGGS